MNPGAGSAFKDPLSAVAAVALSLITIALCVGVVVLVSVRLLEFLPSLEEINRAVLTDAAGTIGLTLFYAVASSVLQVLVGLVAALAVLWTCRGWVRPLVVTTLLLPYAIPSTLVGLLYRYLFAKNADAPLALERWFGIPPDTWYTLHPVSAAIAASVWQFFPFSFLLLYIALAGTPSAQLKSAQLDGAPFWMMTGRIVLRRILPVLFAVFILRFIFMLVKFDTPYVFTEARLASAADVATIEIYRAFQGSADYIAPGESVAAFAVFVLGALAAFIYAWLTAPRTHRNRRGS